MMSTDSRQASAFKYFPGATQKITAAENVSFDQRNQAALWANGTISRNFDDADDNIRVSTSFAIDTNTSQEFLSEHLQALQMHQPIKVGLAKYQDDTLSDLELNQEGKAS